MNDFTPKQQKILIALFQYRGLLFRKLAEICAFYLKVNYTHTFSQNLYKDVQELDDAGFISRESFVFKKRQMYFIQLTEMGLETVSAGLGIQPGKRGTGYGKDYGDFPFELHRPVSKVKSQNTAHHLLTTDVLFELRKLNVESRDNRYCSTTFNYEGKSWIFRPDGDFIVNGKTYLLEIDRHTELLNPLKMKFEGYDRYFKWLKKEGRAIPSGVVVIVEDSSKTGLTRRWHRFLNAYFSTMKDWFSHFNMIFCTVQELYDVVSALKKEKEAIETFLEVIKYYTDGISCSPDMKFAAAKTDSGLYFFAFEQMDVFETRALTSIYALYKYVVNSKLYRDLNEFVPVIYSMTGKRIPLNFKGFKEEEALKKIFNNLIWLRLVDEKGLPSPYWTNKDGKQIESRNPLASWVKSR